MTWFVWPFKLSGKIWSIPSSASSFVSSPSQFFSFPVSISGRTLPKYGCFTSLPSKLLIVVKVWVASPYVAGASPESTGTNPIIAAWCPSDMIYIPTSVASFVITTGVEFDPALVTGPNTPEPNPPVSRSGLDKYLYAIFLLSGPYPFPCLIPWFSISS